MDDPIVILPPRKELTRGLPIIFLAGPIQGTWNWQREATATLTSAGYRGWIASPRPTTLSDEASLPDYHEQIGWEHHHIRKTLLKGVVMFWLAKESAHDPDRSYAQSSLFEIGWVLGHRMHDPRAKIVIGIEEGFSGARYVRRTFEKYAPEVPIFDALADTCKETVRLSSFKK